MNRLDQLAIRFGTDKSSEKHNYTEFYDWLFKDQVFEVKSLLEFGVYKGQSLRMWAHYFPEAEIHGVDIRERNYDHYEKNIYHHVMDSTSREVKNMIKYIVSPDIVIDDAGHSMRSHQLTFDMVFPLLKSGAYYIIEDLHTCYMPEHGGWPGIGDAQKVIKHPDKVGGYGRTVDWLAGLSHAVNFRGSNEVILKKYPYFSQIKAMFFVKSLVCIVKK